MGLTYGEAIALSSKWGSRAPDLINSYVEAVLSSGKWRNTIQEIDIDIFDWDDNGVSRKIISLPQGFETVVGARFAQNQGFSGPVGQQYQWFRYVVSPPAQWGWWRNGQNNLWCSGQMTPLGLFPVFRDVGVDSALRVRTDFAETGKTLAIRGYDTTGQRIYTGSPPNVIDGLVLSLSSSPATTGSAFGAGYPLEMVKSTTNGPIHLFYLDGSTEVEIGTYAPGETVPEYRRYAVPTTDRTWMRVAAKRAYVPLVADNDLVIPDNRVALSRGLEALTYEDKHDSAADYYWDLCYKQLNGNLREYQGQGPRTFQIQGTTEFGNIRTFE